MGVKVITECSCGADYIAQPAYFSHDHKKVFANLKCEGCGHLKISWYDADEIDYAFVETVHGWR